MYSESGERAIDFGTEILKHTIVPYRVICLLKVNETRIYLLALKQGRQKRYGRYGHGLTQLFYVLLEINHIVLKDNIQMNDHTKLIPSRSDVAIEVDYNAHNLIA